ncbi:MAG: alkaline phosphatase PhoX [Acidimicrobiales bacterium]
MDRRTFLRGTGAVIGGGMVAGPFQGFVASAAGAAPKSTGYGPLVPVADHRDGAIRLELPHGFNYRSFHTTGSVLSSGEAIPGRHDGMAAFPGSRRNTSILVRNHEINGPVGAFGDAGDAYDPLTGGGTISVLVDRHGKVLDDWVSLNGTQMNCAGGPTPWGSWLTCEETVNGDDVGSDFTGASNAGLQKHGYVFEVPADGVSDATPIRAAGRFAHEAAAIDPDTGVAYLTEDNFGFASGFYRYTAPSDPRSAGALLDGGVLEMLKVAGSDNEDLSDGESGNTYDVEWVTIDDPDPTFPAGTTNLDAIVAVGDQGRAKGAALFSRLEGAEASGGLIYFVSTQGGATVPPDAAPVGFGDGRGQVWAYDARAATLTCVYESPGSASLDLPDNVVASRSGSLVLCEDGAGDNFLRGLTPDGGLFTFARNADPEQVSQEFAGATFSPDFKTLFVNVQSGSGYSVAIWGPWARGPFA